MSKKIAFIGTEHILRVFHYFGTTVFRVATPQEAGEKLQELVSDKNHDWGIIYIEEHLAESLQKQISELNRGLLPVISIVATSGAKQGIAGKMVNALVRKVTGVEMKFE